MGEITPEAKRLRIVFEECKEEKICDNMTSFAKLLGTTQSNIHRMINGEYALSFKVTKGVCYILRYSPAWFINGEGRKKNDKEDVKLVTEIQTLRSEMNIMENLIKRMDARMKAYEKK